MAKVIALALVLAGACKGESKRVRPPPPKVENVAPACVGVAAKARDQYLDQADQAPTAGTRKYSEYMADAVVLAYERHCTDDKWSERAIACAKSAGSASCDELLTPEQLDKLKKDKKLDL